MRARSLRRHLLLSTTMLAGALACYGRSAYAQCVNVGGSLWECSGANVNQQTISDDNAEVFTVPGFSVITGDARGVSIAGDGALSYFDDNFSPLTAANTALYIRSNGDDGLTPGSVTVDTNGVLTGGDSGIAAYNYGSATLTITANGDVAGTGVNSTGIVARNSGASLSIASQGVTGGSTGIYAGNFGMGALTITANGDVAGTRIDSSFGIFARNYGYGTSLSITSEGVTGGSFGIAAFNRGTEALDITANGDVAGVNHTGIFARNSVYGTSLSVTSAGVTGGNRGIYAGNFGTGALTVTAKGEVAGTGANSTGIFAFNSADSDHGLSIAAGSGSSITGDFRGIYARNLGGGALTVTADGDVAGGAHPFSAGIYAWNGDYSTLNGNGLIVTAGAGSSITGSNSGIHARNFGGALTVTVDGDVAGTGVDSHGIIARNGFYFAPAGTSLTVTTGAGSTVSGVLRGIYAANYGTGALTVTADGEVAGTGLNSTGILARNGFSLYPAGTDLTVTTGAGSSVTGGFRGIDARNFGTGVLSVTATGDVVGTDAGLGTAGIYARNSVNGTSLSVDSQAVTSGGIGLYAGNLGTGALTVTANGAVTSDNTGIFARNNNAASTTLSVTSKGAVTGVTGGLYADHRGTGALTITAKGDVAASGVNSFGIFAQSLNFNSTSLSVTAMGDVTGGDLGIETYHRGSGALTIAAYGDVEGTNHTGIVARKFGNNAGDISVTTATGTTVTGGMFGIRAFNYGSGALTVTANGDVTGTARYGIHAKNYGTDLDVTTGTSATVTGGTLGIYARNDGTGALTVTANGDTSAGFTGIQAQNNNGTDLTLVSNGTVSGNQFGIRARNEGSGALSVTANGDVTSRDFLAIYARNSANGTDLDVTIGAGASITGFDLGIIARNYGADLSVTTGVGSTVSGPGYAGIFAQNADSARDLNVTTGTGSATTGGRFGIQVRNFGSGALSVTANGDVTGTSDNGIDARNYGAGTNLTVTTGTGTTVTGGALGIRATNYGTGDTSVMVNGDVAATTSAALYAVNFDTAGDLAVTTAAGTDVTGLYGILARNLGSGPLTVTANGDVTGTGNAGILARNYGTDLTVATGPLSSVTGGTVGIDALNYGTGALSVTANGDVTGTNVGINARNDAASTGDLAVTTGGGTSVAGAYGIFARNFGTAALSVTANGDVTGTSVTGIYARNSASGTDLSVTSGVGTAVAGGQIGIYARNLGTGALSVTANGDVTGTTTAGISANNVNGTDLSVTTGDGTAVTGGEYGIYAGNAGSGALSVTANGDVTSTNRHGIDARNNASGTDLTVTTGVGSSVRGEQYGIDARHYGNGAFSITANGDVAGGSFAGIYARNFSANAATVSTGAGTNVTGGNEGIRASNESGGPLTITANGDVTGTNNAGILARSLPGSPIDITVGPGATAAGGGVGVEFAGGAANSLNNFGTVNNLNGIGGTAILGDTGDEAVSNFGVVTGSVDLGDGANAFANMQGGLFNSGASVDLGAGNTLTNSGSLSPGGSGSVLATALTGNFVQTGSGRFLVDIQGASADRVDASGSAAVNGKVRPNYTLASLGSSRQWTILTATTPIVDNGIKAVSSTPVVQFDVIFPTATQMDLVVGVDFAVSGLNRNETAIANNLTGIFNAGNFAKLDTVMSAIATLPTSGAVANALEQLSPEVYLDTGIATLFSALSFTNGMMTCPERDGAAAFIREGQCVWARVSGRFYDQDTTFQTLGFDETSFQVTGGGQLALGGAWRLGGALGYEHSELETSTNAGSDGDRFNGGGVLTYNPGPLLLAAAVSGGRGWYGIDRPISFPGFSALAIGDTDIDNVTGRLRAAYLFDFGAWYLKPQVDLDATRLDLHGTNEHGAGGVSLVVQGNNQSYLSASPALELGTQFAMANGTLVRPYVRGGATMFDETDFTLKASFAGTPKGVAPFRIRTGIDELMANVSAGVEVLSVRSASVKLFYDGRFGDTIQENAVGAKATVPF